MLGLMSILLLQSCGQSQNGQTCSRETMAFWHCCLALLLSAQAEEMTRLLGWSEGGRMKSGLGCAQPCCCIRLRDQAHQAAALLEASACRQRVLSAPGAEDADAGWWRAHLHACLASHCRVSSHSHLCSAEVAKIKHKINKMTPGGKRWQK